jgi:PAS domain S-box-containing protein
LYPTEEWKKIRNQNIRQKGMKHHLETKMIKKDGKNIDVDISLSVLKDHEELTIGSIGVFQDITLEKQMKKRIEESEHKFKILYEKAPIPYHTLTKDGIITNINEKWSKTLGYTKKEVLGKSVFNFISEKEKEMSKISFNNKTKSKKNYVGGNERTLITKYGNERTFVIHDFFSSPNSDNDEYSIHTTLEDITQRKIAEEKLIKNEKILKENVEKLQKLNIMLKKSEQKIRESEKLKTEFMNVAAHELKTPIIPIKGYLELLLWDKKLSEDNRKWINIALRNSNILLKLINDVLDVSRLEDNAMKLLKEETDIRDIINGTKEDVIPIMEKKNLKLIIDIPETLSLVKVDKSRIYQILRNLTSNAIKNTDNGSITILCREDKNKIIVSVKDTGVGIAKKDISKLFNKFSQLDSSEVRKSQGTGLGLYICKGILKQHDGEIWAESELGKGSTFSFNLPVIKK